MSLFSKCASVMLLMLFGLGFARAQVSTGTIVGVVQDNTGGVLSGSTVTVTHLATGQIRTTQTNDQGEFNAQFMPLGTYSVTVTAPGYQTKVLSGITLQVDQTANLTIKLKVGSVSQTVEVTSAAPLVDTTSSSLGQVIDNHEVLSMPLNGRNPFQLGLLVGNTAPVTGVATNLPFVGGGGQFSSNDVLLNGIDDNIFATAGNVGRQGIAIFPSVDAVQEFKVMTNNFSAEYGHAAGFIVAASIKSGANQFHGTVFEFVRNNAFDANNYFSNRAGLPKTPFHQNQFGGVVGGPIKHDRVFFFGDYQGTRQSIQSGSSISSVPTAAMRSGDFSGQTAPIFDPRTRHIGPSGTVVATQFPGNKVDPSLINKTAAAIMALIPLPNYGTAGAVASNYFYAPKTFTNTDQADARVDATLTQKNHLIGTYSFSNSHNPAVGVFPSWIGGGTSGINNNEQAGIADVHIFTPSLVNEFRVGYLYNNSTQTGVGTQGASTANSIGLAMFPVTPQGFPGILMNYSGATNGTAEFTGFGGGSPEFNTLQTQQLADNMSWTHGRHSLKWGVDARKSLFEVLLDGLGQTIFGNTFSSSSDSSNSGLPLADFLMGYPTVMSPGSSTLQKGRQREAFFGGYIQDDWKFSNKLTINAGLRYELYTQPIDQNNLGSLFDISTGNLAIPGQNGYSRAMVHGDHNDWGPRVGVAYQVSPKLVVRGGYGIFYAMRAQGQQATLFSQNVPNIPTLILPAITPQGTVTPPYNINTPIQTVPSISSLTSFTAAKPYNVQIKTQSLQDGLMPQLQQYNLDLQYQLSRTLLVEASYSGAKGNHFTSGNIDKNQAPFASALNNTNTQANRPFPNMASNILTLMSIATSNYNALNVKVQNQMSHGLQFLANYSWQKNLQYGGDGPASINQTGTSILMNTYDLRASYSVADMNIAHTVTGSALYQLPVGSGQRFLNVKGPVNTVLGGWVVNGIFSLRTGFPSDVHTSVIPGGINATFNVPDCVVGVPRVLPNHSVDHFFNPAAFTIPQTVPTITGGQETMFGNCGKNIITGPTSKNLDSSLFKNFYFSDSQRIYLQFRAEAFNTTNTPTFYLPAASNATLTCKGNPGTACNSGNPTFGALINGSATGRQIQFAAKLYF
ncbi:MAG TPA: TonB-dependent receptor [Terracidiphilus sp.]|nr:TonB-dependent receptor [Terracidiphilus sp.]